MSKQKGKLMVYSVRLEAEGASRIITLRVGAGFTELSLEKNGKLAEIMRESNNEIVHEIVK